jgi:hypothetical protein
MSTSNKHSSFTARTSCPSGAIYGVSNGLYNDPASETGKGKGALALNHASASASASPTPTLGDATSTGTNTRTTRRPKKPKKMYEAPDYRLETACGKPTVQAIRSGRRV